MHKDYPSGVYILMQTTLGCPMPSFKIFFIKVKSRQISIMIMNSYIPMFENHFTTSLIFSTMYGSIILLLQKKKMKLRVLIKFGVTQIISAWA